MRWLLPTCTYSLETLQQKWVLVIRLATPTARPMRRRRPAQHRHGHRHAHTWTHGLFLTDPGLACPDPLSGDGGSSSRVGLDGYMQCSWICFAWSSRSFYVSGRLRRALLPPALLVRGTTAEEKTFARICWEVPLFFALLSNRIRNKSLCVAFFSQYPPPGVITWWRVLPLWAPYLGHQYN